jgi:TPR repeat protein
MIRLLAMLFAVFCALSVPAGAQAPVPRQYDEDSVMGRADPDKPAARVARENAAAADAQMRCDAGDLAGCAALGRAYMLGEGKPQNRPVAELLFRQTCDGAEASGCLGLGELFWHVPEEEARNLAFIAFQRGCRLGALDACEKTAEAIELGIWAEDSDEASAEALRRETCAKGGAASCRELARSLFSRDRSVTEQAEGRAVIERLCREGDAESCGSLVSRLESEENGNPVELREWRELGCRAGDAMHCRKLAKQAFAAGSGLPEDRTDALALFDRACELETYFCGQADDIRARPALSAGCTQGITADCVALGRLYADSQSELYSPGEAVALLGNACEAGAIAACGTAARLLLNAQEGGLAESRMRAERWYVTACDAGNEDVCFDLGRNLLDGYGLPQDRARGYALLAGVCERGDRFTCDWLVRRGETDPEAPPVPADNDYLPPLTTEEEAEVQQRWREEIQARAAADRAESCTTTRVEFRGIVYEDTICEIAPAMIGGYSLRPGQAPWQAVLWRPARMGGQNLPPGQRVACGGALVASGWILTAAHCIVDKDKKSLLGPGHRIRLGVHNPRADEGVSYPILRAIPHPRYHEPSRAFDIALLQIDPGAGVKGAATNSIRSIRLDPVPLDDRKIADGLPVYTYGWGLTAVDGDSSEYLKGAKLQLEDPAQCTRRTKFRGDLLRDAVLCASAPDRSQACNGDSGGPLITYGDAGKGPTVIGVVSAGEKCGTTGVPSRYTRVAKVRDWIDEVLTGRKPVPGR